MFACIWPSNLLYEAKSSFHDYPKKVNRRALHNSSKVRMTCGSKVAPSNVQPDSKASIQIWFWPLNSAFLMPTLTYKAAIQAGPQSPQASSLAPRFTKAFTRRGIGKEVQSSVMMTFDVKNIFGNFRYLAFKYPFPPITVWRYLSLYRTGFSSAFLFTGHPSVPCRRIFVNV